MIKAMLLVLLVMVAVAGLGIGLCAAAGWPVHLKEMLVTGVVMLVTAELAQVPVFLAQGSDPGQTAMIGLAGTVVHLLLSMILLVLALALGLYKPTLPFAWWALAFYWASLTTVVAVVVGEVRKTEGRNVKTN